MFLIFSEIVLELQKSVKYSLTVNNVTSCEMWLLFGVNEIVW